MKRPAIQFLVSIAFMGVTISSVAQLVKPIVTVDDFQRKNSMTINKSAWYTYSDVENGGKSILSFSYQKETNSKNITLKATYKLAQGTWKWTPYAFLACSLTSKQIPPGVQAIAYEFKGCSHSLVYRSSNIKDYAFYQKNIPASKGWATVTVPISELVQPSWGSKASFSDVDLFSLAWKIEGPSGDSGMFSIDNVRLLYTPQLVLQPKSDINIGVIKTMHSSILNEDRDLWISLPASLDEMKKSPNKYPVVYVLDGDSHVRSLGSMVEQLGPQWRNSILPEMIVVGIPNTSRWRDLSPSHINRTPFKIDTTYLKYTGGGENFMMFMEKELIPFIDSIYPTSTDRTFVGHSLGGLLVLNTLVHHPHIFNSYLAIDPSLWWNDQLLNKQAESSLKNSDLQDKRLFIAIANTISDGYDTVTVRTDTTNAALHMRSIFEFTDLLKKQPQTGLKWKYAYYSNDSHNSVTVIAHYDGIRYFFDDRRKKPK